jgi:hypothetical protein
MINNSLIRELLLPRLGAGSLAHAEEGSERQEDGAGTTIVLMAPARCHGRQRHRSRPPRRRPRRCHRESRGMAPSRGTPWRRSNGRRPDADCGEPGASAAALRRQAVVPRTGGGRRRFAQEGSSASTGKEGSRSGGARHARRSQDCARVIKKGRGDRALCVLRYFFSMKGSAR